MIGGMNFVLGCVENKQLREVDSFCEYRRRSSGVSMQQMEVTRKSEDKDRKL